MGRDEPAVTMDSNGKLIWARHSELCQASLRGMDFTGIRDGERLTVPIKDAGAAEIFPQTLKHNANGRFVVACGDGEYIIYTSMALRNKVRIVVSRIRSFRIPDIVWRISIFYFRRLDPHLSSSGVTTRLNMRFENLQPQSK